MRMLMNAEIKHIQQKGCISGHYPDSTIKGIKRNYAERVTDKTPEELRLENARLLMETDHKYTSSKYVRHIEESLSHYQSALFNANKRISELEVLLNIPGDNKTLGYFINRLNDLSTENKLLKKYLHKLCREYKEEIAANNKLLNTIDDLKRASRNSD